MPEEEESAASIPRLWLLFLSLGCLHCLRQWDLFYCREGFAFRPKDNHLYGPSPLQFLCYSPFRGTMKALSSSLPLDGNVDPQILFLPGALENHLAAGGMAGRASNLLFPTISLFKTELSWICFTCKWMELAAWDASSSGVLSGMSAHSLSISGPPLCREVYFFALLATN